MTDLGKFSVFFEYAANPTYRDTVNKVIESEEVLQMAGNLLMNISQDERERAIFSSRKKFQMDHASDMATARDNAIADRNFEIARKLLQRNSMTIAEIAEVTGLTADEVEDLKRQLFQ